MTQKQRTQTIISFFRSTTLLLLLVLVFGCGNSDNIGLLPIKDGDPSDDMLLAAPAVTEEQYDEVTKVIGSAGGKLSVGNKGCLFVPPGALNDATLIAMTVISDGESYLKFHFQPHGLVFNVPVEIQLSWATLKEMPFENMLLYYYDDSIGEWLPETSAVFDEQTKKATLYINHFSYYYYERR